MERIKSKNKNLITKNYNLLLVFTIILSIKIGFAQPNKGILIVANKSENTVSIIELESNKTTIIDTGIGPHEIAISKNKDVAVITNYGNKESLGNSLSIIGIKNKKLIKTIDLGSYQRPHGISFINKDEVLVTCEKQKSLIKVNITNDKVSLVVNTGQKGGHMLALDNRKNLVYVANIASKTISKIDINTKKVLQNIILTKPIEAINLAKNSNEIWTAYLKDSIVKVIDANSFKTIAEIPSGKGPIRVEISPDNRLAAVSNFESGTITVYDTKHYNPIKSISLVDPEKNDANGKIKPPLPVGITFNPQGSLLFVSCMYYDYVAVIDTNTWKIINKIKTGKTPDGIAYYN